MRTASYRVSDLQRFTIPLGFVGENEHCQIVFLAEDVYQEYPHAAASLTVRPPYGEPYPAVVTRDGNNVLWTVKDSDLTRSGQGEIQLSFTTGEVVAKTYVGKTKICRSIQPTGDVPDPIEDFLTEAGAALTAIPETIDAALEAAKESGEFDGPQGPEGPEGPEGPAGADGAPGQDGAPGTDGFSPTATVTKSGKVATITITDKDGTTIETVRDGEDGTTDIDDTSTALDKVWSAHKTDEEVGSLKSAFTTLQESFTIAVPSKNLYDKNSCSPQDGKTYHNSNGNVTDSSVGAITGKIPVSENTQYIFSCGGLAVVKKASYFSGEAGGTYLSYETIDGAAFTTPAGCTFVGITFFNVSHTTEQYNAALAVAQLERGNEATPYVPYGSDSYTFTLPATTADEGKPLTPKTVSNGNVVEWEYKEIESVSVDDTLTQQGEAADAKAVGDIFGEISEIVYSKNLYNSAACSPQNGKTYNSTTGIAEDNSSYAITGKIPVEAQTQYIFSTQSLAKVKRAFYYSGSDGSTYLSTEVLDNAAFTTPNNCTFVALNLFAATHTAEQYTAAIAVSMLEKGNVATNYVPYSETRKISTDSLVDGDAVAGAKNYTVMDSLVNHFDKAQCVDGKYFNNTYHEIYDNTSYGFSGLIPVKPNTQYNISCDKTLAVGKMASYYQEWDATKTFIQQTQQNNAFSYISQIQTGVNTHYISINLPFDAAHTTAQFNSLIDSIMLVEGMQIPPAYVAYNLQPVVDHTKLDNSYQQNQVDKWRGKKWLVTGTSVSYQDSHVFTGGIHEGEVCRGYIGNVSRNKPMLITNEGISGSTLAKTDQDSALINRYQNLNFGSYDFITVEYGINDFGNNVPVGTENDAAGTSSFAACLKTIIEYAIAQNPLVGLIICTEPDVRGTTTNNNGNTLKDFTDVTIAIAKQYRLPVCDWFYNSGINALNKGDGTDEYTTADGTHPSNYGHMRMGAMLNQMFDNLLC